MLASRSVVGRRYLYVSGFGGSMLALPLASMLLSP
jgi:hypothetical protein